MFTFREQTTPSPDQSKKNHSQEPFYQHLADKVEHLQPVDHKFKPFRTLRNEKSPSSKQSNVKWENTAATPPTFKYNDGTKVINIEESVELQLNTEEKLKVILSYLINNFQRSNVKPIGLTYYDIS